MNCGNSISKKIVELSHDAYEKDYGISVLRNFSVDLLKNCVMGEDIIVPDGGSRKNLADGIVSLYFHLHPAVVCKKKGNGVLIKTPEDKKMYFTHIGGYLSMEKSTYIGNFSEPQEIIKLVIKDHIKHNESKINWKLEEIID